MAITLQDYLTSLQGKRVAVIGIGVSNTPLIKTLLQAGISVTACDKAPAQHSVPWLTSWSPWVQCFIWGCLSGWSRPGCHFSALREFVPIFHRFCPPWKREVR